MSTSACVCRLPAEATLTFDESEKTDSDTTVVTVVEGESTRFIDESASVIDDEQSLFSVDQDGFFTSMHADSGLAVRQAARASRSSSTHVHSSTADSSDIRKNSTNVSVETGSSFSQRSLGAGTEGSDVVSVTALTLQLSSSSQSSLSVCATAGKPDIGQRPAGNGRSGQTSGATRAEKGRAFFKSASSTPAADTGAYLSLCSVTPPSSDEDEAASDDETFEGTTGRASDDGDRRQQTRNGALSPSATVSTPLPPTHAPAEHDHSLLGYYTLPDAACGVKSATDSDRFSTWPCSPVPARRNSSVRGILKCKSDSANYRQPRQKLIKFSEVVSAGDEATYYRASSGESHGEVTASSAWSAADETDIVENSNSTMTVTSGSQDNDTTVQSEGATASDHCSATETWSTSELNGLATLVFHTVYQNSVSNNVVLALISYSFYSCLNPVFIVGCSLVV